MPPRVSLCQLSPKPPSTDEAPRPAVGAPSTDEVGERWNRRKQRTSDPLLGSATGTDPGWLSYCDRTTLTSVYREVRWTDWSEDHIRRHAVAPGEVEDVLFGRPRWIAKGRDGATLVFGSTISGRLLLVVTVDEGDGVAFIVTAREMTQQEKRTFHRKAR